MDAYGECKIDCEVFIRTVEFGFLVGHCRKVGGQWWNIYHPVELGEPEDYTTPPNLEFVIRPK